MMTKNLWYKVENEDQIITPALFVYPERIKKNIESMIRISGANQRLIPHVKTYKMQAVVKMQMEYGIKQFKCATLGELQMLISCGVDHILLAIQPTKEKMLRFLEAQVKNPKISFSTLVDNEASLDLFSELAFAQNQKINLWVDINNGMNRTGITPEKAVDLYMKLMMHPEIIAKGLHIYDGHIRPPLLEERIKKCDAAFESVKKLIKTSKERGGEVPEHITGGSPSFYPHAHREHNLLSPGTTLLWDLGYQRIWKEAPFQHAAVLVTRLISKPSDNIYCFDLGHKALASEMPLPRVEIFGLEESILKGQSEEHLMVEYKKENNFKIGDLFYAIPYHICPTVAKYSKAYTVRDKKLGSFWEIEARDYQFGAL